MKITRRQFSAGCALTAAGSSMALGAAPFPKGFLWGVATAAYQVEGNNINTDLWVLEHVKPTIFQEMSGDACDHYHR